MKTILVVDDEPNIVDVISMALKFQGFAVESAGTGQDAISQVAEFKPDLIVLDVMLPDMEGFDVAQRLGAQHARVPIIYLTARDATEDKIRGLSLGGDDCAVAGRPAFVTRWDGRRDPVDFIDIGLLNALQELPRIR